MKPNRTNYYFSPLEYNPRLKAVPVYTAENIPIALQSTMCEITEENPNIANRGDFLQYFPNSQVCNDIEEYRKNYTERTIPSNGNRIYNNALKNSTTGNIQKKKDPKKKAVQIISGTLAALIIGILSHQTYSVVNNLVNDAKLNNAITTMANIEASNLNITHRTKDNQYWFYDTDKMARNAMKAIENYQDLYNKSTIQQIKELPSLRIFIDLVISSAYDSMTVNRIKNMNSFYINLSLSASDTFLNAYYNFEDYVKGCGFVNEDGTPKL